MVLAGLVLAVTLAQGAASHQAPPETDETVPAPPRGRLTINNFAGEVNIHTWAKDTIHVVARHQSHTKVNIKPTAAGVAISASGLRGPQGSVDYDITAPGWMPIKVDGQFNFVTVDGAQAEVSAESVRGDIVIKGGTGFITAKSIEGEIVVEGARGKVSASSINEGIKISDTSGEITADSVNGAITMTRMDSKNVEASTVNGDITYEGTLPDGGHYNFATHNGDLLLAVPETANATFTVRTYNGEFRSDLALEGGSPEQMKRGKRVSLTLGTGSADVNLESFGGEIRIRKATVTRSRGRQ
jgi:DUF4097 and DUF4098 domain-containing protein YvlB